MGVPFSPEPRNQPSIVFLLYLTAPSEDNPFSG